MIGIILYVVVGIALLILTLVIVPMIGNLASDEVHGWLPYWTERVVRFAASRLPPDDADRYREEWLAELAAYDDRPLTKLWFALDLVRGTQDMRKELAGTIRPGLYTRLASAIVQTIRIATIATAIAGFTLAAALPALLIGAHGSGLVFNLVIGTVWTVMFRDRIMTLAYRIATVPLTLLTKHMEARLRRQEAILERLLEERRILENRARAADLRDPNLPG